MQKPTSARSEFIVGGKYKLQQKIGSGSFGDIYKGLNITNGEVCMEQYHYPSLGYGKLGCCCFSLIVCHT